MVERTSVGTVTVIAAIAATLACLAGIAPAQAQGSESVTVDLRECVDLKSPDERFACYERRVEAAREAQAPASDDRDAAPEPAARNGGAAAPPTPEAGAGTAAARNASDPEAARSAPADEAANGQEFTGRITKLQEREPNTYLITLDNGQVWLQARPQWYPLRPGLEVRIYPSRWGGSYRLAGTELDSFIQVKRVH